MGRLVMRIFWDQKSKSVNIGARFFMFIAGPLTARVLLDECLSIQEKMGLDGGNYKINLKLPDYQKFSIADKIYETMSRNQEIGQDEETLIFFCIIFDQ